MYIYEYTKYIYIRARAHIYIYHLSFHNTVSLYSSCYLLQSSPLTWGLSATKTAHIWRHPTPAGLALYFLLPWWKKTSYLIGDPDIAERAKNVQTFFYLWWCLEQTPFIKELAGNNSSPAWPWVLCPPVKAKQICPKPGARRSFHHRT